MREGSEGTPTREVDGDQIGPAELASLEACSSCPTEVEICHGNLAFVQAPVALGHYEGDAIVGSEATLDRLLDGRLSQRWKLGRYPGAVETVELVLSKDAGGLEIGGAIILGLGTVGGLTPGRLVKSFRQAVVQYGIHLTETDCSQPAQAVEATLAVPLIGSGDQGVSIEESLLAILEATAIANRDFGRVARDRAVRIARLQIVELYLDRAVEAAQVLMDLSSDRTRAQNFHFAGEIRSLSGGLWRVLRTREQSWWRQLQVRTGEGGEMQFSDLSNRAGAQQQPVATQSRLIQELKDELLGTGGYPLPAHQRQASLAATLYELLVPNGFKKFGPKRSNILLLLDERAACLPWELLRDERPRFSTGPHGAQEDAQDPQGCVSDIEALRPVAVRTGLVRQLIDSEIRHPVVSANGNMALIVGDPDNGGRQLAGARNEAEHICQLLRDRSFEVTSSLGASATEVMQDLMAQPYRVVHLAGHGTLPAPTFKQINGAPSTAQGSLGSSIQGPGMVLSDDSYLTAIELEQLDVVPEFVFVNCCHLGRIEGQLDSGQVEMARQRASSFALQLIQIGVRSVIAAAWKVDDDAARHFASLFYELMLDGKRFGEAVLRARREIFEKYPGNNTWGAYQAYGDPHFQLKLPQFVGQLPAMPESFVEKNEVIAELNNLVSMAATTSEKRIRDLLERLGQLRSIVSDQWLGRSSVQVAFAEAYRELDRIEEAIGFYSSALEVDKSTIPIRSLEHRCTLLADLALRRWRDPLDKSFGAREASLEIEDCLRLVWDLPRTDGRWHEDDRLMTEERFALVASMHKRLALLEPLDRRGDRLLVTAKLYAQAHHLHQERRQTTDLYPYLNYLSCRVVCDLRGDAMLDEDFDQDMVKARAVLKEKRGQDPSFWNLVRLAEIEWLESLGLGRLADQLDNIAALLSTGWIRAGTLRQARALFEHLCWLEAMTEPPARSQHGASKQRREAACEALSILRSRFEIMVGEELGDPDWAGFSSART